jgi:hypothetical protein
MWTEPLYTAEEMRAVEEAHDGPMIELMERAGSAAAEAVLRRYPTRAASRSGAGRVPTAATASSSRASSTRRAGLSKSCSRREEKVAGDAAENLERRTKLKIPFAEPAAATWRSTRSSAPASPASRGRGGALDRGAQRPRRPDPLRGRAERSRRVDGPGRGRGVKARRRSPSTGARSASSSRPGGSTQARSRWPTSGSQPVGRGTSTSPSRS